MGRQMGRERERAVSEKMGSERVFVLEKMGSQRELYQKK